MSDLSETSFSEDHEEIEIAGPYQVALAHVVRHVFVLWHRYFFRYRSFLKIVNDIHRYNNKSLDFLISIIVIVNTDITS